MTNTVTVNKPRTETVPARSLMDHVLAASFLTPSLAETLE